MRALGRAGTLAVAGAAAGYFLRRQGLLGRPPAALAPAAEPPSAPPSEPLFVPQPEPAPAQSAVDEPESVTGEVQEVAQPEPDAPEVEPVPEDAELVGVEVEPEPEEAEGTEEFPAAEEPLDPDPEEVVEPPPAEEERPDVTAVVDDLLAGGSPREGAMADAQVVASEDARVAEAVRIALAETPGLLSGPIDIEVENGRVTLVGELERPESIAAVERKAEAVEGVRGLRSFLHLPGTPPPSGP